MVKDHFKKTGKEHRGRVSWRKKKDNVKMSYNLKKRIRFVANFIFFKIIIMIKTKYLFYNLQIIQPKNNT